MRERGGNKGRKEEGGGWVNSIHCGRCLLDYYSAAREEGGEEEKEEEEEGNVPLPRRFLLRTRPMRMDGCGRQL